MKSSVQNIDSKQDFDKTLHDFMGFIGEEFGRNAQDAGEGQAMLEIGVKTAFAQKWERFLADPLDSMYQTRQHIDSTLRKIVNAMVEAFLQTKKDIIGRAYAVEVGNGYLYYCISLNDDTLENRIEVNDFFDFYQNQSISNRYPVRFQYVPDSLMDNIKVLQEICLK